MCRNCGSSYRQYNTTQTICQKCAYNRYAKPAKPIKRVGKVASKWIEYRAQWFVEHQPDKNGYYICGICKKPVHIDETVLDHIKPKSGNPELRFVDSNIQPAHWICNSVKGSKRV